MKRIVLILLFGVIFTAGYAQQPGIGIGTTIPDASSQLDVSSTDRGVLIPRMTSAQRDAIESPANGLLVFDTDRQCISQNVGTSSAPDWVCISGNVVRFFYMPAITFDTSEDAVGQTKDLYQLYKDQFSMSDPNTTASSAGAPATIPSFPEATDLYYYITYYDPDVFSSVSIDANGIMTYDVTAAATDCSFINIVFAIK